MLEKVEVRQLVQGIPIAITVLVGSPMSWSEDNHISVVTQLGTYIFELTLSPEDGTPGVMFSRFFIPPPAQPNPYLDTEIIVKNVVDHVDRNVAHTMMLDGFLTPSERAWNELDPRLNRNTSPAMPGGDPSHRGFCKGSWSPYGMGLQGRCLLTLVTYDHRVMIMGREGHKCTQLIDMSAIWYKKVSHNSWKLVPIPKGAASHEIHIARMHMLGISEIQWTPLFYNNGDKFSIFIMITISGHAVFWKIPAECTTTTDVQLLSVEETKMKLTSAIYWFTSEEKSGYLILGSSNGQVKIFYIKFAEKFVLKDLGYAYDSTDRIRVNHLKMLHLQDKLHLLLLGKQNFLLAVVLNLWESELTPHCTAHSQLGRLPISGMICLENNNVYVSMKDGNIQHVYVRVEKNDVQIEQLDAPFRSEGVAYTGLVTSPHGTLWGILESVSVAYDHLVVREPSQISIYQVGCGAKILEYLQKSQVSLHFNVDLLESLRLHICKSGESSVKLITPDHIDNHTEPRLKLHYWLTKMCRSIRVNDQGNMYPLDGIEAALESHIIEHWITSTIKRFSTEKLNCEPSLFLSLSIMCRWIMNNGKEKEKTIAIYLSKKLDGRDTEQCPICKEVVPLNLLTSGTCTKGHTLPRCCRTLLLTKPVIMCSRCKVFAHKLASELQIEKVATCLYCDGRMTQLTKRRN